MLDDLMEILGGAGGQGAAAGDDTDPLMDILGGILGGGAQAQRRQTRQPAPANDPLSDILGAIMGGSGQQSLGASPFLAPIANALAERMGISPQMATQVLGFALAILTSFMQSKAQGKSGAGSGRTAPQQPGFDLDDLLDEQYLQRSGMTSRLAQESGMDEQKAARSLQEALLLLSNPRQAAKTAPRGKPSTLDHLLDSWETD